MPELPYGLRQRLRGCARLMAGYSTRAKIGDFAAYEDLLESSQPLIAAFLAEEMERLTNGRRTVRLADSDLFTRWPPFTRLYLAACPASTPAGCIMVVTAETDLFVLGPKHGFGSGIAAHPQKVLIRRINAAKRPHTMAHVSRMHALMDEFLLQLHEAIGWVVADVGELDKLEAIAKYWPKPKLRYFQLNDAANACVILGCSIADLLMLRLTRQLPVAA